MHKPKNHEFTTTTFDYGHRTGVMLEINIKNFKWRGAVIGPASLCKERLMQQFWRRLGAQ